MKDSIWHTFDELPIDYMWESARADKNGRCDISIVVLEKGWDQCLEMPIYVGRPWIYIEYGKEELMMDDRDEGGGSSIKYIEYWAFSEDFFCKEMFSMYPQTDDLKERLEGPADRSINKNARARLKSSGQNQNQPECPR